MPNIALSIAATGINVAQTAMDTISENLSNVNTPGYLSETADIVTNLGGTPPGIGEGASVTGISQNSDWLLTTASQQAQGGLAQTSSLQQILQTAQGTFPDLTTGGLSQDLSSFWQSWDGVSQNPSSQAARQQVLGTAQTVTHDLNSAATALSSIQTQAQSQLSGVLTSANGLLSQVASLNTQIVATQSAGQSAASLVDQRNNVMNELATDIGAVGKPQANGMIQVTAGSSVLVNGGAYSSLATSGSVPNESVVATPQGSSTWSAALTSGTVSPGGSAAGVLSSMNVYLSNYSNALDSVAQDLATTVNTQLGKGYTATGAAGTALFSGTTASTISLAISDPSALAAATNASAATNDGSNAQAMAELYNAQTGPDAAYTALVQQVGNDLQTANSQVTTQTAVSNSAQANLQAVTGVNSDQQMVDLINFQQAYQASAKVISTVDAAVQSLLNAV